jgi:hypothetical protein
MVKNIGSEVVNLNEFFLYCSEGYYYLNFLIGEVFPTAMARLRSSVNSPCIGPRASILARLCAAPQYNAPALSYL